MNVLSLFNGMSFGKMALESLSVPVTKYYSSEIDKYANQATQAMFPDTIQLGDAIIVEKVIRWKRSTIEKALKSKYLKKGAIKINMALPIKKAVEDGIDLVTGGFPCQAWSMAGKQLGDKDERGMLFWTMLDIMKYVRYHNPKADFLIENVKMKKEFEQYITTHTENALGKVHKILINSALLSAQNRNRYYWSSFKVEQPEDKGILLKDIIERGRFCGDIAIRASVRPNAGTFFNGKSPTLLAGMGIGGGLVPLISDTDTVIKFKGKAIDIEDRKQYRKLTPRECFRLQTVPDHHIDTLLSSGISNTQLYKMCGNGWTMEVIKHIFKAMLND
jgi:site-specific DNA-cytosine methylase